MKKNFSKIPKTQIKICAMQMPEHKTPAQHK